MSSQLDDLINSPALTDDDYKAPRTVQRLTERRQTLIWHDGYRVIQVHSDKGGQGKSFVTVNFGAGLALRGYNVCLVDTDPQGHIAESMNVFHPPDPDNPPKNPPQPHPYSDALFNLLVKNHALDETTVRQIEPYRYVPDNWDGSVGKLLYIASHEATREIGVHRLPNGKFNALLEDIHRAFDIDIFVIDTGANLAGIENMLNFATDYAVIPTRPARLDMAGLLSMEAKRLQFNSTEKSRPPINLLGVIPNMARLSVTKHKERIAQLKASKAFRGQVTGVLPLLANLDGAFEMGLTVFGYLYPSSPEFQGMMALVDKLHERMMEFEEGKR